jgi:hypothetical protein
VTADLRRAAVSCPNPDHEYDGPYIPPSVVAVTWPDGRFRPTTACRVCLKQILGDYLADGDPDSYEQHAIVITPIGQPLPDQSALWQALKDYLSESIEADEAVRWGMVNDAEEALAAPFGGLVSANRSTLKKMRELEKS